MPWTGRPGMPAEPSPATSGIPCCDDRTHLTTGSERETRSNRCRVDYGHPYIEHDRVFSRAPEAAVRRGLSERLPGRGQRPCRRPAGSLLRGRETRQRARSKARASSASRHDATVGSRRGPPERGHANRGPQLLARSTLAGVGSALPANDVAPDRPRWNPRPGSTPRRVPLAHIRVSTAAATITSGISCAAAAVSTLHSLRCRSPRRWRAPRRRGSARSSRRCRAACGCWRR